MPPATKLDVTGERALARLTFEWEDAVPIMDDLIGTVAPGVAMRYYAAKTPRSEESISAVPEHVRVASGARRIVNERLGTLAKSGKIEIGHWDGKRWLRLKPRVPMITVRCNDCGHEHQHAKKFVVDN